MFSHSPLIYRPYSTHDLTHAPNVSYSTALTSLKPINVLCVVPEQNSFVLQQSHEAVGQAGRVLARVQLLGQAEERLRVAGEVRHVKHCGRVREVILLKVVVETGSWGPFGRSTNSVGIKSTQCPKICSL